MAAGVDRATIELLGLPGATSSADPSRRRAAVLLTDGTPTRPFGPERPADNTRAALRAADRARLAGIRVSTLAIVRRETNSWRWPVFQWVWMGALAWLLAFATWRIGLAFGLS